MSGSVYKTHAPCTLTAVQGRRPVEYKATLIDMSMDGGRIVSEVALPGGTPAKVGFTAGGRSEISVKITGLSTHAAGGYRLAFVVAGGVWPYTLFSELSRMPSAEEERAAPPDCLVALGLFPPCSKRDVQDAYYLKVRKAHPDRGGDIESFTRLRAAYLEALELVGGK
ncbi:MAG: hypothetical protein ACRC1K_12865 [Planctomycetia bacterium]